MKIWYELLRAQANEEGTALVILTLAMTVLIGSTALVADLGVNYVTQARLAVAADAAALAGGTLLGAGRDRAIQAAKEMAEKNGITADAVVVEVAPNNRGVSVTTKAPVRLFFGRIFGLQAAGMEQQAHVVLARPISMDQLVPLGIDQEMDFKIGSRRLLFAKNDNSGEINLGSGNSGALEFAAQSTGAQGFEKQLRLGWPELISKGDILETKSGVKFSAVKRAMEDRLTRAAALNHECNPNSCPPHCPRIVYVPVYRPLPNGENKVKQVEVVDFAAFWLDGTRRANGSWEIAKEIPGIFIGIQKGGLLSVAGESPYGIRTGKLVR
ncbi:MAG: hypothetical protein KGZ54_00570 [Dethiobacter sp.]|nr:hypothetical protein [Dethiobacter sp.]